MNIVPATQKWSLVTVEWEDAAHYGEPENSVSFIAGYVCPIRTTAGWYLGTDNLRVFIAMSRDEHANYDSDCQAVDIIPLGMIRKFTLLQPVPERAIKATR